MKLCLALVAAAALLFFGLDAFAQTTFEVVGTFPQTLGMPQHGLVETSDGSVVGLARFGGAGDAGALFQVDDTHHTVLKLAEFASIGGEIGDESLGLAADSSGMVYGVTPYGGANGDGTLWSWTSASGLVKLANFIGTTTGEKPHGNVVWDGAATLYGVCESGGQFNAGTLWRWSAAGGLVNLYSFQNYGDALSLGGRPQSLALNGSTLYGITLERDPNGSDIPVMWSRSSTGTMKQAAIFDSDVDGFPLGPIAACDTGIVGISYASEATRNGVNRLWRFTGSKTVSIVKAFATTEQNVSLGTTDDFTMHGTTSTGKVWSWAPDEPFAFLGTIPAAVGAPNGQILISTNGELRGTALKDTDGSGSVWHWSPAATDVDATFDALPMGGDPNGLWIDDAGSVFGVETIKQLIWRWSPATGGTPTRLADVEHPLIGFVTFGNVVGDYGGNLFGFTKLGAAGNAGVLWRWNAQAGLVKLGSFGTVAVPGNATGAIVCDLSGDNIYGTTEQVVGTLTRTHLWRWNSISGLTRIATLDSADGGKPTHTLVMSADGGAIYGTTTTGGAHNKGTLWAWTVADGVQNLADFGTATLSSPGDGLAVSPLGAVFGVTTSGGTTGDGRLWKWLPVSGLSVVKDFDHDTTGSMIGTDGTGMIITADGLLYGTTANGGAKGVGTLWSCNIGSATPAINTVKAFDPTELSHPGAQRLMQAPDGMIYGLALHGIWRYGVPSSTIAAPAAVTLPPSYISATRVIMDAAVNAQGSSTSVSIEFGTDPDTLSFGGPTTPATVTGSTATPVTLASALSLPDTLYYYRIKATNANGTTYGDIQSFRSSKSLKATVVTLPATDVTTHGFTFHGKVATPTADTTVNVKFGAVSLDHSDSATVVAIPGTITSTTPVNVTGSVSGLKPHLRYSYRTEASNEDGTVIGNTLEVSTLDTPPVAKDDNAVVLPSGAVRIDALGNDTDADNDTLSLLSFTQPTASAGKVTRDGNTLIFTATSTFTNVTFTYTVSDGFGGKSAATVNVTRGTASLNPTSFTLPSAGGSYPVHITTTSAWSVVSGATWITASPTSGIGVGDVTLTAAPWTGISARIGTVVIGGEAHTLTQHGVVAPAITTIASVPEGILCGSYHLNIPTTGLPVVYSAINLPPGLRLTALGNIEGIPTRADTYNVTVKATNAAGSASIPLSIKINPLGSNVVGAFTALFERHTLNAQLGGLLTINTTAAGTLTGTLCSGTSKYALNDHVDGWANGTPAPITSSIDIAGLRLNITFGATLTDQSITATLQPIASTAAADIAHAAGARHSWGGTTAIAYSGSFNSLLDLTTNLSDSAVPQGSGFTIHKVLASGATSWTGKLSDGTAISGGSALWPDGSVPMWQLIYTANTGSVFGSSIFAVPTGVVTGSLDWLRKAQPLTERKYRAGFGPLSIDISGGRYLAPITGTRIPGITNNLGNARLRFFEGALASSNQGANVNQIFPVTNANLAQLAAAGSPNNLTGVKLTLTPTTGQFSGSFTLRDSNVITPSKPYMRTVNYEGVIVPSLSKGAGYFLLNGLPGDLNWKTLSGQVVLDPAP